MSRNILVAILVAFGYCLIASTTAERAAAAPPTPVIQNYPSGTFHGYYQQPYPNNVTPRQTYGAPTIGGNETNMNGTNNAYYIPSYDEYYPYYRQQNQQQQIPGEQVSPYPYTTDGFGRSLRGRMPWNVPEVSGDGYASAQPDNRARLNVRVPADALVWFDATRTASTGTLRSFQSPELTPGEIYTYTIRARWTQNGREVTQSRQVDVRAGAQVILSFPTQSASSAGGGTNR
jgi:uncharacterized protein (TIGR03000 family)